MTTRRYSAVRKKRVILRLCKEAFKTVEDNAGGLAAALLKSAEEGKVMSTKLLVELADRNVDVEQRPTVGPLRSLALKLAAEPQLPRESLDETAETEAESRELVEA